MRIPSFRKSPFSLPPEQYGGTRKRVFLGLMAASCLALCLFLAVFLVVPWVFLDEHLRILGHVSVALGTGMIVLLIWLCLSLVAPMIMGRPVPGMNFARRAAIRVFFPLMEILGRVSGVGRDRVRRSFVKVNNEIVLAGGVRADRPERLLLLLPHCIQRSSCPRRLTHDVDLCARCCQCPVGDLLELRDRHGFSMAIATGGTIARRIVVERRPAVIVAVACERDLTSGIRDSHPLPVFGILNERPCGPCRDTLVPLGPLEAAIRLFLGGDSGNLPERRAGRSRSGVSRETHVSEAGESPDSGDRQ